MSDNKKWYKLTFKQIQPIHIGAGSYGVINETRIFIPGWTMWGALTKAYNLKNKRSLSDNQNAFEEISCFWPSFDENGEKVLFPKYKSGKFCLGDDYPENKFRAMFVDTYTSTAILPGSRMAKEESLHEINVILPGAKADFNPENKEKQLYWAGIVNIDKNIKENFLKEKLNITIGGDSRYGFGLMRLVKTIDIDKKSDEFRKFKSANYILLNKLGIEANIELLVDAIGYKGNELKVKNPDYYYIPGHNENGPELKLKKGKLKIKF